MNKALVIARKDTKVLLSSPATYIVLVVFLVITGWYFSSTVFLNGRAELRGLFSILPVVFLFIVPAITMGMIAREKSSGTIEPLATMPVSESQIIMGKFYASLLVLGIGLVLTILYLAAILFFTPSIDYGAIFCGYFGMILLGAVYTAIGIFGSTLHGNQIVAFIISFAIAFFFFVMEYVLYLIPGKFAGFVQYLSFNYHISNFLRGIIDTRDLIYFASLIFLFLKFAQISLQIKKGK